MEQEPTTNNTDESLEELIDKINDIIEMCEEYSNFGLDDFGYSGKSIDSNGIDDIIDQMNSNFYLVEGEISNIEEYFTDNNISNDNVKEFAHLQFEWSAYRNWHDTIINELEDLPNDIYLVPEDKLDEYIIEELDDPLIDKVRNGHSFPYTYLTFDEDSYVSDVRADFIDIELFGCDYYYRG